VAIEVFHKSNTYVDEGMRVDRENGQWLCCVSAYTASFDSWTKAEMEWQAVLDFLGLLQIVWCDFASF